MFHISLCTAKSECYLFLLSHPQVQMIVYIQSVVVVMKTSGTNSSFKHWTNCGMCTACVAPTAERPWTKESVSFAMVTFCARQISSGKQ